MKLNDIPEHLRKFNWYAPHLQFLQLLDDGSVKPIRADLSDANLTRTNLSGANLYGANLSSANLSGAEGLVSFGPVGTRGRIGYVVQHDPEPMVRLGCWWETLSETIEILEQNRTPGYVAIVKAAALVLSERTK